MSNFTPTLATKLKKGGEGVRKSLSDAEAARPKQQSRRRLEWEGSTTSFTLSRGGGRGKHSVAPSQPFGNAMGRY